MNQEDSNSFHVAKELLKYGANINSTSSSNRTPLYIATLKGHLKLVNLLCLRNADVNIADNEGNTPLHLAI